MKHTSNILVIAYLVLGNVLVAARRPDYRAQVGSARSQGTRRPCRRPAQYTGRRRSLGPAARPVCLARRAQTFNARRNETVGKRTNNSTCNAAAIYNRTGVSTPHPPHVTLPVLTTLHLPPRVIGRTDQVKGPLIRLPTFISPAQHIIYPTLCSENLANSTL